MKAIVRKTINVFAVLFIVFLFVFVYWPMATSQYRNLNLAKKQAKILQDKFGNDPRFFDVKFARYTSLGGCLKVFGTVQNEEDIHFVTNAVESIKSSVGIDFELELMTSNQAVRFYWFDKSDKAPVFEKADLPQHSQ
jgi:hypothetical protein